MRGKKERETRCQKLAKSTEFRKPQNNNTFATYECTGNIALFPMKGERSLKSPLQFHLSLHFPPPSSQRISLSSSSPPHPLSSLTPSLPSLSQRFAIPFKDLLNSAQCDIVVQISHSLDSFDVESERGRELRVV